MWALDLASSVTRVFIMWKCGLRLVESLSNLAGGKETLTNRVFSCGSTEASKRSAYHYDLWNMKYLKRFKWDNLTEEIGTCTLLLANFCDLKELFSLSRHAGFLWLFWGNIASLPRRNINNTDFCLQLIRMLLGNKDWLLRYLLPRKSVISSCRRLTNLELSLLWRSGRKRYLVS